MMDISPDSMTDRFIQCILKNMDGFFGMMTNENGSIQLLERRQMPITPSYLSSPSGPAYQQVEGWGKKDDNNIISTCPAV